MTFPLLIERLEKATEGSRELDRRLATMAGWTVTERIGGNRHFQPPTGWVGSNGPMCGPPEFTTSLDAAIALSERVLPGWTWFMASGSAPEPYYEATLFGPDENATSGEQIAKSPALALCLAICRALALRDEE